MRTRQLIILFCFFIFGIMQSQTPNYVPSNGLKGWYSFSGNANDLSGNANNGTVFGATLTTDRFGNSNSAYSFNGTSDYISAPQTLSSYAISFWYYTSLNPNTTGIGQYFDFYDYENSYCQKINDIIYVRKQNLSDPSLEVTTTYTPSLMNWHHVVVNYNSISSNLDVYIDNVNQYSSITATGGVFNSIANNSIIYFGANALFNTNYLNGKLDDIGIWDRLLNPTEIDGLFNACSINLTQGLIGKYDFNGNANDLSGNANHGVVNGVSLTSDRFGNVNKAFDFDGINNNIFVQNLNQSNFSNDYTISAWVYFRNYNNSYPQIAWGTNNYLSFSGCGPVYAPNYREKVGFYTTSSTSTQQPFGNFISQDTVKTNQWHHIVVSKQGTLINMYLDNILTISSNSYQNLPLMNGNGLYFGNYPTQPSSGLDGKIDDIVIYNRGINLCEIDSLFNIPNPLSTSIESLQITQNNIVIYPNPTSDFISVKINSNELIVDFEIYNILGEKVMKTKINSGESKIDICNLQNGVYFLMMKDSKMNALKFIKN